MADTVSFEDAWGASPKKTLSFEEAQSLPSKVVDFMKNYTRSIVGQGMGVGFGDEAEAGVRSIIPGQGGYSENLDRIRGEMGEFAQEHPVIATGSELAGGLATAALTRGRTAPQSLAAATARAAGTGAGYGAAYGFGTGEGAENRAVGAGAGGAAGAALGMVAAPLAQGGAWVGRTLAQPVINRVRSALHPEAEAGRRVATALQVDQRNAGGITPGAVSAPFARQVSGQPMMNMDEGGEVTRRLARSAANQSPEAGAILEQRINDRFQGQGERVLNWLRNRGGGSGDVSATREDLLARARRANRPAYRQAYTAGDRGIWSPELERLTGSPDVLAAMKSASQTGKSRAINDGFGTFNPGVRFNQQDVLEFVPNAKGQRTYPNLQYWDYVKRELDDAANAARRAGRNEEAGRIGEQARMLRDELDNMVPEYRGARQGAAAFFQAENALEAGENFLSLNADLGAARRAFSQMSQPEQELFREGFVSSLMDKIAKTDDRRDVVRKIWGGAKAREQIDMVLGNRAPEFEAFMTVEQLMDDARQALGNSTTARQLVELGLAAGAGAGAYGYTGDPATGVLVAALTRGGRALSGRALQAVDDSVARRVATMLTSDDPTIYRRGLQTVARSQRLMGNIRSFFSTTAAVGGGQLGAGMVSP
jgi:hypothetical protein